MHTSTQNQSNHYHVSHLDLLEAEAIYVLREVAAELERSALMFSAGKDSIAILHLARKAFHPGKIPFKVIHYDSDQNFPEVISYRNRIIQDYRVDFQAYSIKEQRDLGNISVRKQELGQTSALIDLINFSVEELNLQALIGGARRDEDKTRAKERIFSVRDDFGEWNPKQQRPEVWNIFNTRINEGEHMRSFPISNWTELDVWNYIKREGLELPEVYFAHERQVVKRKGNILAYYPGIIEPVKDEKIEIEKIRFRTVGDISTTGGILSDASDIDQIISEVSKARNSERSSRADDQRSAHDMEDRKKRGWP